MPNQSTFQHEQQGGHTSEEESADFWGHISPISNIRNENDFVVIFVLTISCNNWHCTNDNQGKHQSIYVTVNKHVNKQSTLKV